MRCCRAAYVINIYFFSTFRGKDTKIIGVHKNVHKSLVVWKIIPTFAPRTKHFEL